MASTDFYIFLNKDVKHISVKTSDLKHIDFGSFSINSPDRIIEVSITDDLVVIHTEDPAFRTGKAQADFSELSTNVINAYNWNGQLVWTLNDIIKDAKPPIWGGFLIKKSTVRELFVSEEEYNSFDNPLYSCFIGGLKYVLDLKTNRILGKFFTK